VKTRRKFVISALAAGATLISLGNKTVAAASGRADDQPRDRAEDPRITRARLSGPAHVTRDATVAEFGVGGTLNILVQGSNPWVCIPGDENKIGDPPMCMNPMGMRWMMDAKQGKPRPTNRSVGQDQSRDPDRTALDDYLALRCRNLWPADNSS
jgi:hypothetical protein